MALFYHPLLPPHRAPLPDDEMGIILYELAQSKQDSMDNPRPRGRPKKRRVGRPRKYRHLSDDDDDLIDDEEECKFF